MKVILKYQFRTVTPTGNSFFSKPVVLSSVFDGSDDDVSFLFLVFPSQLFSQTDTIVEQKMTIDRKNTSAGDKVCVSSLLPIEIWRNHILPLLGDGHHRYIAGTSRQFQHIYSEIEPKRVTHFIESVAQAELALHEVADKTALCRLVARNGHLALLQFLWHERECPWDAMTCAAAARGLERPFIAGDFPNLDICDR
jgi:hypothetical protein